MREDLEPEGLGQGQTSRRGPRAASLVWGEHEEHRKVKRSGSQPTPSHLLQLYQTDTQLIRTLGHTPLWGQC